jgi:hypothetical protein
VLLAITNSYDENAKAAVVPVVLKWVLFPPQKLRIMDLGPPRIAYVHIRFHQNQLPLLTLKHADRHTSQFPQYVILIHILE